MFTGMGGSVEDHGDIDARVKSAAEMYDDTKSALHYPALTKSQRPHAFAGERVMMDGRALNTPSDRDRAISGAWGKFICNAAVKGSRTMGWMSLPDHDKELILYAMEHKEWGGTNNANIPKLGDYADIVNRKLTPHEQKALIDDATSGGTEAAPIVFDEDVIRTPLLFAEFYPLVKQVPLDKGRRIQGVSIGTVTSSWGGVDGSAIDLFDTTSYVSGFDTTIYRWQGSVLIGLDFLSDTPIDFAQILTQQYGEVLMKDLDIAICVGNGTTQPEGVMTKTGTTTVAWGGTTTLGNYESLRFGVHKREHTPALMRTAVFGGTDTSYQRAISLPVGTSDARRLSGPVNMPNYDGYSWMGRAYKINESLTNSEIFYAILGNYRMYNRRGLTISSTTEGQTLKRANEMLIVATARFGGQMERGSCVAKTTTAPA
jgi:HK97 family phage major capsid protein